MQSTPLITAPSSWSRFWLALLVLAVASIGSAADLREVQPVTDKILMLHFSDGHEDYWNPATQSIANNVMYSEPLDTATAEATATYHLSSADDAAYGSPAVALTVGRKTKGQDFNSIWYGSIQVILEHWVYVEFPTALQPGKSYTLTLAAGLVGNGSQRTFTFDPAQQRSPTIHVSQLGFPTAAPKFVYLSQWMGSFANATHTAGGLELDDYAGAPFTVVDDASGTVAFSGTIHKRKDKTEQDSSNTSIWGPTGNYTLSDVYDGDFSALSVPGRYRVVVARMGSSFPFEIHDDIYRKAFRQAMRGMFLMRQGIIQEVEPGLEYPRDHYVGDPGITMGYDPNYHFGTTGDHNLAANGFDFTSHPIDGGIWGWYHDAGDWDSYVGAHCTSAAQMLLLYRQKPGAFHDGDVGNRYRLVAGGPLIDEGTNGLPDLLDEARWHIDYLRRMRAVLIAKGYGTGGIPGYVGVDAGADRASWLDLRRLGVTAEDPSATYLYATCCALFAHDLNLFWHQDHPGASHPEAAGYLAEAVSAAAWAKAKEDADPTIVAGLNSARFAANLALFIANGDVAKQAIARALWDSGYSERYFAVWAGLYFPMVVESFYGCLPGDTTGLDATFWTQVHDNSAFKGNAELVVTAANSGFRFGIADNMWFTAGPFTTPGTSGMSAHAHNGSPAVLAALQERCAYHLGGNELNMSHMTGIGQYREHAVFHPDSWALFNDDGPVYTSEQFPGFSVYMRVQFDLWSGDGSESQFSQPTLYPPSTTLVAVGADGAWPYSERRIPNRNSIAGSEYTNHQSNVQNIAAYGYLCSDTTRLEHAAITRPSVTLNVAGGVSIERSRAFPLTCHGSGDIRRVEYYYDWHYIGESSDAANGFRCMWKPADTTVTNDSHLLTVVAWNQDGERCKRTAAVEATVTISSAAPVPATGLSISGLASTTVAVNRSYQLVATETPAGASYSPLLWASSDPAVATVSPDGLVSVVGVGTATISVRTADDAVTAQVVLTAVQVPLTALVITGTPTYLSRGRTVALAAVQVPADTSDLVLTWSTSDPAIATVDGAGVVTGVAAGTVIITVSGAGGAVSATATFPVREIALSAIAIGNLPTAGLAKHGTVSLAPIFFPADASDRTVTWTSSDATVATIDGDGVVHAVGLGTTIITVTAASGPSASAPLSVVPIYEGFDYAPGSTAGANGGTGWGGPWLVTGGAFTAQSGSLIPTGGPTTLARSGGSAYIDNTDGTTWATRPLATARLDGHTWFSALMRYKANYGYDWAGSTMFLSKAGICKIGFGIDGQADTRFFAWAVGGDWGAGAWLTDKQILTPVYPSDEVALFALHADHAAATISFYLNPTPGADVASLVPFGTYTAADSPGLDSASMSFDGIAIQRSNTPPNAVYWDEIRVGDTWAEVAPVASPGSIVLATSSLGIAEGDAGNTTVRVAVRRVGGAQGTAKVHYHTGGGTATAGTDYTAASGTLTWADGDQADKSFTIKVRGDTTVEEDETVLITLDGPSGASLGSVATATLTILNDDAAPNPGFLAFAAPSSTQVEGNSGDTTVNVTVTRTGGSVGAVSVLCATSDGTATAGTDYVAASRTLSWVDGDSAAKLFTVTVHGDLAVETDETVQLTLSHVSGAALGSQSSAVLSIVNDDAPVTDAGGGDSAQGDGKGKCGLGSGLAVLSGFLALFIGLRARGRAVRRR